MEILETLKKMKQSDNFSNEPGKKAFIKFKGYDDFGESGRCEFRIKLPEDTDIDDKIFSTYDWVKKTNFLKKGSVVDLTKEEEVFLFTIEGIGHDGRCRLCKSFRTLLEKDLREKGIKLVKMGHCKFE